MKLSLKKIKKILLSSAFGLATLTLASCAPSISSVGIGVYQLWAKYNSLDSYITNNSSNALKWISQRTISLAFELKNKSTNKAVYEFGTAWIYAKEANQGSNDFSYYLATNMHVLSNLNSLNNTTTRYEVSKNGIKTELPQYELQSIYFNFISDDNVSSLNRNNDGSLDYLWSDGTLIDTTYIKLETKDVSIAYTAIGNNLVANSSSLYVNPYTNSQITNPSIDFGLIKIDFSNVKDQKNKDSANNNDDYITVENFLKTYDSNPTKFKSSNQIDYSETFYMGGFPEASLSWKPNRNSAWIGLTNIKLSEENEFVALAYDNTIDYIDLSSPMGPMPEVGSIDYVTRQSNGNNNIDANWYRNVAKELIIGAGNLGGGASGSMFISQDSNGQFAVLGIYWGIYGYSMTSGISYSYGVVDLLKADSYSYIIEERGIKYNYTFPSYNVLDSIKTQLNITPTYI